MLLPSPRQAVIRYIVIIKKKIYCDHQENEVVVLTTCHVEIGCFDNCCIRVKKTKSQVEKPLKRTEMAIWESGLKI